MANIIMKDQTSPNCPLCFRKYYRVKHKSLATDYFMCEHCKIYIRDNDRFLNRWVDEVQVGHCEICEVPVRTFQKDNGFVKELCPVCGAGAEFGSMDD